MPELPEVETVRAGLSRLLPSKRILSVTHDWAKSFPNAVADVQEFLIGSTILSVQRRAKVLIIELDSKYSLLIHLKMTGQLVYRGDQDFGAGHPNDSLVNELPDKSTRVIFELSGSAKLFFNDQRKFGWVKLVPSIEIPNTDFFKRVGPEPLSAEFTWQEFRERLQRRKNTNIKAAILDQSIIAGIGNIYADESLWGAKIHPTTLVKNVSDVQIELLYQEAREVLQLSIDNGGSSNQTYVDAEGNKGNYMTFANVFKREGKPCNRCGTIIIKTRVAARGTHLCPTCQKEPS